jgi:PPP family 3-phenylpropionic acid transporter
MTGNHVLTGPAGERLPAARLALFYGAYFAAVGIHLPFWPVWLEWRGLGAVEIGYVLAAGYWPRVATNLVIPAVSDRLGERRRPMILLTAGTLAGMLLFALARDFWPLLLLSVLTGATWAAILPLGEAVALGEAQRRDLDYGRIRLWGSIAFILAAIAIGRWLEHAGPAIVLWSIAAVVACILGACMLLPEGPTRARPAAFADFRRLAGTPEFLAFVAAAAAIQVSHAVYYGFATLHWRAAGHGELVIGLLWAESVVAEVALFACAGALLRRLGPIRLLIVAGALTVVRWALSALSTDVAVLVPAQALHAASFGATHLAAIIICVTTRRPSCTPAPRASTPRSVRRCRSVCSRRSRAGCTAPRAGMRSGSWPCWRSPAPRSPQAWRCSIQARFPAPDDASSPSGRPESADRTRMPGECRGARSGRSWCKSTMLNA